MSEGKASPHRDPTQTIPEPVGEGKWALADTQASGKTSTPPRPSEDDIDARRLKASIKGRLFGGKSDEARIDRFVVLKRIGEGGMGVVYAAYDGELDRKVAIKLLHPDASVDGGSEQATARLLREAQALARVSHPNVVQIYEVGTHGEEVYVAMEFIEGATLAEWMATDQPHPWKTVLTKFIAAGRGLAAAHAKKLVHRDFKPANVLVGDDGQVRVLDFGLARRVRGVTTGVSSPDPRSSASALNLTITRAGLRLGTPAYMSPEQHVGGEIDARTDQFAFCVSLYEALYGQRPFGGQNLPDLQRNVTQGRMRKPPRGSKVPEWVRRVVMRGLNVEADERWPSMNALLEQLSRDPGARTRKLVAVAGLVAVATGGTGVGYYLHEQGVQACAGGAARLEGIWDAERKREVEQALLSTGAPIAGETFGRVSALLDEYTDGWVDQFTKACIATQAGEQSDEMLDLRMACLDQRLDALSAQVGVLVEADDTVLERAVAAAAELPPLMPCADTVALAAQVRPPDDPEVAKNVKRVRETLAQADALAEAGKFGDALVVASGAVAEAQHLEYLPVLAEAQLRKGRRELDVEDYAGADVTLANAYWTAVEAEHDEVAADAASGRMTALAQLDRREESMEWAAHAKAVVGRLGRGGEAEARMRESLGLVLQKQAKYEQSDEELRQAFDLYEASRGAEAPRLAEVVHRMGIGLYRLRKYPDARAKFEEAVALRNRILGEGHPQNAASFNGIGATFDAEGRLDEAKANYERALSISEEAFGRDHLSAARTLNNLGVLAKLNGRFDEAEQRYKRALAIYEKHLGPENRDVARTLSNLGSVYEAKKDYGQALEVALRALAIREKVLGSDHPDTADSLDNVGEVHANMGDSESALVHYAKALAIREQVLAPEHPSIARTLLLMGRATVDSEAEAAVGLFARAAAGYEAGQDAAGAAESRFDQAKTLWQIGRDRDEAIALARRARDAYAGLGPDHELHVDAIARWLADRSYPSG